MSALDSRINCLTVLRCAEVKAGNSYLESISALRQPAAAALFRSQIGA